MKHVQVFQLSDPVVMVIPESSREIQYHCMSGRPPVPVIGDESPCYALPLTETVTCPVHCLKHAVRGRVYSDIAMNDEFIEREFGPGYVHDPEQGIWVKTQYIAMGPELFKMLDTVVRQPYEERERVRAARLQDAYNRIEKHKRIVNAFWALPWYKRVWSAITKDC